MEPRIIVCGVVVKGDFVLLGKKAKGRPPYPDVWHTLGGGVSSYDTTAPLLAAKDYERKTMIILTSIKNYNVSCTKKGGSVSETFAVSACAIAPFLERQ